MSTQVTTFENLDYKALSGWIVEKNREIRQFCEASKDKWDDDRVAILKSRNDELEAAQKRFSQLAEVEEIYRRATEQKKAMDDPQYKVPFAGKESVTAANIAQQQQYGRPQEQAVKSIGEMFTESEAYKSVGDHHNQRMPYRLEIDGAAVKTTMTTAAGYAPPNNRSDIVIPYAVRQPVVADVIPVVQTGNSVISWMEETTVLTATQAQSAIAEGNAKFENTLAFTERTATVETVGTWLPVTNQQLDDVPGIQEIINNRMTDFLRRQEEAYLLSGTGSTPQIGGFLIVSGTNAFARTTETNIDAIWQGIQACRVTGFAEPDAIIMHPTNFTPIRLYKATTGEYSFDVTTDSGGLVRLFGKPLILTTAITLNTALVGSFRTFSAIWRKMGLTVQVGLNADDFTKNKKTILAEYREALTIYRPAAFTKVTALQ